MFVFTFFPLSVSLKRCVLVSFPVSLQNNKKANFVVKPDFGCEGHVQREAGTSNEDTKTLKIQKNDFFIRGILLFQFLLHHFY